MLLSSFYQKRAIFKRPSQLRRLRSAFVAVSLVLQFAGAGLSCAGEGSKTWPGPAGIPEPPASPAQPDDSLPTDRSRKDEITAIEHDIDEVHDILEEDILDRVIRLDNFFGRTKNDS